MTEAEKTHFREVHARMQVGYRRAEEDRDARIRETSTADGILSLRRAFGLSAQLPPRPTCGLVDFYRVIKRVR